MLERHREFEGRLSWEIEAGHGGGADYRYFADP
jgi:hypothetical protein